MAARTDFGLYGSAQFGDKAIFLIPNHAQERIKVPTLPGSDILSRYIHLFMVSLTGFCFGISQIVKIPCGDLILLILRKVFFSIVLITMFFFMCFSTQALFSLRKLSLQKTGPIFIL